MAGVSRRVALTPTHIQQSSLAVNYAALEWNWPLPTPCGIPLRANEFGWIICEAPERVKRKTDAAYHGVR